MALTAKQEAFCLAFVATGKPVDAYRAAGYSPGMSDKTAGEAASRLLKDSKILARLAIVRAPAAQKAGITLESHLADLESLRDKATQSNQFSAAIAAEIARGKAAGVHVEKSEQLVTTKALPATVEDFV